MLLLASCGSSTGGVIDARGTDSAPAHDDATISASIDAAHDAADDANLTDAPIGPKPVVSITSGPTGSTEDPLPSIAFTTTNDATMSRCEVDTGGFNECTSPFTSSLLSSGQHTILVQASNIYGTGSAMTSFTEDLPTWTTGSQETSPSARDYLAMTYDSTKGRVVMFGGSVNATFPIDTWLWNGSSWSHPTPTHSPTGRNQAAMTFDSNRSVSVMFGGSSTAAALDETWEWNGADWTEAAPVDSPSGRLSPALIYDSVDGYTLLFGGQDATGTLYKDTWTWDGTNWTQLFPVHSPSARFGAGIAYDATHSRAVLYGGEEEGQSLDDTWLWNGTDWTQPAQQSSIGSFSYSNMVFDSTTGRVVLVVDGVTAQWDGDLWSRVSPPTAIARVITPGVAYDSAHDDVVVFGGFDDGANGLSDSTWLYSPE